MMQWHIFKFHAGLADSLAAIMDMNILAARLGRYEYCAQLRDIEKQLENIAGNSGCYRSAASHPGRGAKNRMYHNFLFSYCSAHSWKNIPRHIERSLHERKVKLNDSTLFTNNEAANLNALEGQLLDIETSLVEYCDLIKIGSVTNCNDRQYDTACGYLNCYTQSKCYEFPAGSFDPEMPFYRLSIALVDFMSARPLFYQAERADNDLFQTLPAALSHEKHCLLFSLLANDGLLTWVDLLNVGRFTLDVEVYQRITLPEKPAPQRSNI